MKNKTGLNDDDDDDDGNVAGGDTKIESHVAGGSK